MENQENLQPTDCNAPKEAKIAENLTPNDAPDTIQVTYDATKVRQMIEEAEKRGYLRGRNEQIEAWLMTPESNAPGSSFDICNDDDSCPEFLSHIRPGFWD